jgi:hypothetical protein
MGLTWAVAHFGVGVAVALANWQFGVDAFGNGFTWLAYNSLLSAATGFVCGTAFSAVLGIAEGRRRFDQMSMPRFAIWGAVGGAVVAGALTATLGWGTPSLLANLSILSLLGAGCAAGSLALARVADDRELLDAGSEVADVGLTDGEVRELLARGR